MAEKSKLSNSKSLIYRRKDKKKGKACKKWSSNKSSKNYRKPYARQGR